MERRPPNIDQVRIAAEELAARMRSEHDKPLTFLLSEYMNQHFLCGVEWTADSMITFFQELKDCLEEPVLLGNYTDLKINYDMEV
jgi:hypothetical protein